MSIATSVRDIFPLGINLKAIDPNNRHHIRFAKEHLEFRSDLKFDEESVRYILEDYRKSKYHLERTVFEFATKMGHIAKLGER